MFGGILGTLSAFKKETQAKSEVEEKQKEKLRQVENKVRGRTMNA